MLTPQRRIQHDEELVVVGEGEKDRSGRYQQGWGIDCSHMIGGEGSRIEPN